MSRKRPESRVSLEKLEIEYGAVQSLAKRFSDELVRQLIILLDRDKIPLGFPIESRVKSWESIVEKVKRLSLVLSSVTDLQDLIGIRLVTLFQRDSELICGLISGTFNVIQREDTASRLRGDQFGYSSIHFVISLPEVWLAVPSFSSLPKLKAEIQVRTVAQHLWAAASHILQYKRETNVPEPIRRSIHRASALLETVDLEFERVLKEREVYRRELDLSVSPTALNTDSVGLLLDSLLPAENKDDDKEDYEELLADLRNFDITTAEQLVDLLKKHRDAILAMEADEVTRRAKHHDFHGSSDKNRILQKGVFFTHVGLVRCALEREIGKEKWDDYMSSRPLCELWDVDTE